MHCHFLKHEDLGMMDTTYVCAEGACPCSSWTNYTLIPYDYDCVKNALTVPTTSPQPTISSVYPLSVMYSSTNALNAVITLTGVNFGVNVQTTLTVTVVSTTTTSYACSSPLWRSSTSVICTLPTSLPSGSYTVTIVVNNSPVSATNTAVSFAVSSYTDPCASYTTCANCSLQQSCGWCINKGICIGSQAPVLTDGPSNTCSLTSCYNQLDWVTYWTIINVPGTTCPTTTSCYSKTSGVSRTFVTFSVFFLSSLIATLCMLLVV